MFLTSRRKANWYLKKGIAEDIIGDASSIKLKFKPNQLGHHGDDFYLNEKDNICVCCGSSCELTRHHVIPKCFSRYMPAKYTKHSSHDVLLLCRVCHEKYEDSATAIKMQMIEPFAQNYSEVRKASSAARAILNNYDNLSFERFQHYFHIIENYLDNDFSQEALRNLANINSGYQKNWWAEYIANLENLDEFNKFWRSHFIETLKPKYLPHGWSVDRLPSLILAEQKQEEYSL